MKRFISLLLLITVLSSVLLISPAYAATTLQTPRIYSPDDTVQMGSIEFDWSDVSGARYYIFALRDETTGTKVIDNKQISSSQYTLSSGNFKVGHTYKLAIGAYAADDNQSWTNPYYFEVVAPQMDAPYFTAPQNGATLTYANVTVKWNSVREASYYLFSLRDVTTNQLLLDNVKSYSAYYTVNRSMLTKGHEYKVAVGAFDSYGNQKWDNPSYFNIEADQVAPPPVAVNNPAIIYPYNNSAVDYENIIALWTEEPLASHYIFSLRIISTNQLVYNRSTSSNSHFIIQKDMIEPGVQYKWAAAAVVNGIEYWTELAYFTVNQQKLIAPVIATSNLQSVKEGTDVFINWSSSAGANAYMISVLNVTDNVKVINNTTVYTNSYALGKHLLKPNKQYKVAVGAMYSNGKEAWADPVYFDVLYNPPAILDASVNNGIAGDLFDFKIKVNKYTTYVDLYDENNYFIERITNFKDYGDYKISQYQRYVQNAGNRSLKLYAGNDAVILGNPTLLNFSVEKASTQVASFDITAPTLQSKHKMDSNLWVQWNAPATPKEVVYNLKMYHNNGMVYSKNGVNATSLSIPMNFFNNAGSYSIDIYALKSGFEQAISSVTFDVVSPISSWAVKSVETLKAQNIIKTDLVETWVDTPKVNMTRSDFAEILVSLYEHLIKTQTPYIRLDLNQAKNFTDIGLLSASKQLAVKKANALGIVNGYANNTFDPNGPVTREQLATMLRNVYYAINGYDLDMKNADWRQNFSDASSISSWAYESVRFVNALEILNGTGAKFEPKAFATKEMGLVLADKAASVLSGLNQAMQMKIEGTQSVSSTGKLYLDASYKAIKLGKVINNVIWSSNNTTVVNVFNGYVEGHKSGQATISAVYKNKSYNKALTVNVPSTGVDKAQSQSISIKNLNLKGLTQGLCFIGVDGYEAYYNGSNVAFKKSDGSSVSLATHNELIMSVYRYKVVNGSTKFYDYSGNLITNSDLISKLQIIKTAEDIYYSKLVDVLKYNQDMYKAVDLQLKAEFRKKLGRFFVSGGYDYLGNLLDGDVKNDKSGIVLSFGKSFMNEFVVKSSLWDSNGSAKKIAPQDIIIDLANVIDNINKWNYLEVQTKFKDTESVLNQLMSQYKKKIDTKGSRLIDQTQATQIVTMYDDFSINKEGFVYIFAMYQFYKDDMYDPNKSIFSNISTSLLKGAGELLSLNLENFSGLIKSVLDNSEVVKLKAISNDIVVLNNQFTRYPNNAYRVISAITNLHDEFKDAFELFELVKSGKYQMSNNPYRNYIY